MTNITEGGQDELSRHTKTRKILAKIRQRARNPRLVMGFFIGLYNPCYMGDKNTKLCGGGTMVSPHNLHDIKRVLDDIRKEFPIKEALCYEEKIQQIVNEKVWDVLGNLETKYEKEADFVMRDMAVKLGGVDEEIL